MADTFLGLSYPYWSIPCLMLAVVWSVIWPSMRAQGAGHLRWLLLRWGHAATWYCLGAAAFCAGTGLAGGARTGGVLALLAAVAYLAFLYVLITTVPPKAPKETVPPKAMENETNRGKAQ